MNQSEIEEIARELRLSLTGLSESAHEYLRNISKGHISKLSQLQSRNAELEARVKELEGTLTIDNYTFQIFKDGSLRISNRSGESMGMSLKLFSERFDEFFSKWF